MKSKKKEIVQIFRSLNTGQDQSSQKKKTKENAARQGMNHQNTKYKQATGEYTSNQTN